MTKPLDLNLVLAHNLRFFMDRHTLYKNPNALGIAAGIAPNTVRNFLDHKKRTTTTEKAEGFPTLDRLAALADKLGCQVWELLHPDIERSIKEREFYQRIEANYKNLAEAPEGEESRWPADAITGRRKSKQ